MFINNRANDPQRTIDPRIASAFNRDRDVANSQAMGQITASANNAAGVIGATKAAQPAEFARNMGGAYAAYAPAAADAYGSYASGLNNAATQMSNERTGMYSANALAEAARQAAVGSIGAGALGAYGSIGNSALAAWGQNQAAYNKAMSDMHGANQSAMSQYGQVRNQSLGGLANAYAGAGRGFQAAGALGNLSGQPSGFEATGTDGTIASGSYGSGGAAGVGPDYSQQTFGALNNIGNALIDPDIPNRMDRGADIGRAQVDAQHYSSRMMPSMMMDQALGGLTSLGSQAYGSGATGMNQFYANQNAAGNQFNQSMPGILDSLRTGYEGVAGDLRGGFGNTTQNMGRLFNRTIANDYKNPAIWGQPVGAFT